MWRFYAPLQSVEHCNVDNKISQDTVELNNGPSLWSPADLNGQRSVKLKVQNPTIDRDDVIEKLKQCTCDYVHPGSTKMDCFPCASPVVNGRYSSKLPTGPPPDDHGHLTGTSESYCCNDGSRPDSTDIDDCPVSCSPPGGNGHCSCSPKTQNPPIDHDEVTGSMKHRASSDDSLESMKIGSSAIPYPISDASGLDSNKMLTQHSLDEHSSFADTLEHCIRDDDTPDFTKIDNCPMSCSPSGVNGQNTSRLKTQQPPDDHDHFIHAMNHNAKLQVDLQLPQGVKMERGPKLYKRRHGKRIFLSSFLVNEPDCIRKLDALEEKPEDPRCSDVVTDETNITDLLRELQKQYQTAVEMTAILSTERHHFKKGTRMT